ncbi:MAG: alpha/beta hydrolase [Anaerolineae bacterium]|nr:alpha/beta hydrolase [Anaerolineae bacterium]
MSTQYLHVSDGTLAYDDQGAGSLVLCVPGLGDVRGEYRFLTPRLVEAGYRVVTMDVRGHGETSANWPDYTVAAVGSDMLALIKHLDAGPALIIGTSMAAGAAVCAAADVPDLVAGIVLIGPFVRVLGPAWKSRLMANALAFPLWGVAVWEKYYTSLYPTARPADFADYLAHLKGNLKEPGRLSALKAMLADTKAGSDARLSKVQVPVHILMGTRDPDFKQPEQEVELLVERLHATSAMIQGAGHYPHAEMPELAATSILTFFESLKETAVHAN